MTDDTILSQIIEREGGFVDDPADRGGATKYGIAAATLGLWRQLGRAATREEVRALTTDEALRIYRKRFLEDTGIGRISDPRVRAQVLDDAVLSGPNAAIHALQQVLGVPTDGILGTATIGKAAATETTVLCHALAKERVLRLAKLVQRDPSQARFLVGWLDRVLGFIA